MRGSGNSFSVLVVLLASAVIGDKLPVETHHGGEKVDYGDFLKPNKDALEEWIKPESDEKQPFIPDSGEKPDAANLGFIHSFVAAVSVIVVSELGDKTFFIAAIMAMRHPRIIVFLGAILALSLMTVLSACLGFATTFIPRTYTYYISTALFALFGLKMLKEGYYMKPDEGKEELEEVQQELRKRDEETAETDRPLSNGDVETGVPDTDEVKVKRRKATEPTAFSRFVRWFMPKIFLQAFTMTFLAEWGDRSQLTTIILAARENAYGVTLGGIVGHAFCTALAIIGGRMVAQRISVRTVTLVGGVVFLVFALSALFIDPTGDS